MYLFSQEAIRVCVPPKWDVSERKSPKQHMLKRRSLNPFQTGIGRGALQEKMEWPA